jgi:hypothetical protein
VAWWLSSQTQLRNPIRACCVPPPVTDREEKVVSAKENRKPTASPALEDLLMLKRAVACDASFCVGYHGNSALYRNSSRRLPKPFVEVGISRIPEWKGSANETGSLMK